MQDCYKKNKENDMEEDAEMYLVDYTYPDEDQEELVVKKTYKKKEHWEEDEINCRNSKRSDLLGTRLVPVYSVGHLRQESVDPALEELMVNSRTQADSAAPPSFVVHSNSVEFAFQQNICATKKKICGCRR